MDNRPIGVFDTGVGGISVLKVLNKIMPHECFFYYGDTKNAPYGERAEEDIRRLTLSAANHLMDKKIKALVIACNTATSAAAETLRAQLNIPVVGMEPALKPAACEHTTGKILVMATSATLRQKKFLRLMEIYGKDALLVSCPGLMEFAERGELNSAALNAYLTERFAPYRHEDVDAIVLGCTHYVFLKQAIGAQWPGTPLFDGNTGTARRLQSLLSRADAFREGSGEVIFESSDPQALPVMQRMFALGDEE